LFRGLCFVFVSFVLFFRFFRSLRFGVALFFLLLWWAVWVCEVFGKPTLPFRIITILSENYYLFTKQCKGLGKSIFRMKIFAEPSENHSLVEHHCKTLGKPTIRMRTIATLAGKTIIFNTELMRNALCTFPFDLRTSSSWPLQVKPILSFSINAKPQGTQYLIQTYCKRLRKTIFWMKLISSPWESHYFIWKSLQNLWKPYILNSNPSKTLGKPILD